MKYEDAFHLGFAKRWAAVARMVTLGALGAWLVACGGESAAPFPGGGEVDAGGAGGGTGGSAGEAGTGGSGGDVDAGTCTSDQKTCDGACVSKTDPAYGCAASSCDPCELPHAAAACVDDGTCAVDACDDGFVDCDGEPLNGCEGNVLNDPANCGACGSQCSAPGGTPVCDQGKCAVSSCDDGKGDCDDDPTNGCETDFATAVGSCGFCGNACETPYATPKCDAGVCKVDTCDAGRGNCDALDDNGCEVALETSLDNCGACAHACPEPASSTAACNAGQCETSCNDGYADCNQDQTDGCEVDMQADASNCGGCGTACAVANGVPKCEAGTCQVGLCNTGWGDCDADPANGCEVDLGSSVHDCGTCGTTCVTPPNAAPTCVAGACGIECATSYADCDANQTNGCEVALATDTQNCGACGAVCSTPNAVPSCQASTCKIGSCNQGFADCNTTAADGCEVNLGTSLSNCGACGTACSAPHGTPVCQSGTCQVAGCDTGYANCNNQPADGCEVSTATSVANCGACGFVCNLPNATPACQAGACQIAACAPAYADCNKTASDGCEVNLNTSLADCGACGAVCDLPHAAETCQSGACTPGTCDSGWANCDGAPANGCEANITNDVANCGTCGKQCSFANAQSMCLSGGCGIFDCNAGWGNCDSVLANGCESNLQNTLAHCGSCGNACSFPNATASCTAGKCTLGQCSTGYADCDGDPSNGCEARLATDSANCGACGHDCQGTACSAGLCSPRVLASGQNNPWSIATDGSYVYWDNRRATGGTVQRVPSQGGMVELLASNLSDPDGLAINATRVFWANLGSGTIQSVPLAGGTATTVASVPGTSPAGVALSSTHVFWTEWGSGAIRRTTLGGGAIQNVSTSGNSNPHRIATDGTFVWWANFANNTVRRAGVDGTAVTTIASGQSNATGVALDGAYVYWTNQGNGLVSRAPIAGGAVAVLASGQSRPTGIAVDGTHVYWTESNATGTVRRVPLAGGAVETLAANQAQPVYIALDAASVVWTNAAAGTVMKLAK